MELQAIVFHTSYSWWWITAYPLWFIFVSNNPSIISIALCFVCISMAFSNPKFSIILSSSTSFHTSSSWTWNTSIELNYGYQCSRWTQTLLHSVLYANNICIDSYIRVIKVTDPNWTCSVAQKLSISFTNMSFYPICLHCIIQQLNIRKYR